MLGLVKYHLYIYQKQSSTEPCGTPLKTLQGVEVHSSHITLCDKKDEIQLSTSLLIP